jgi:serine/threonine-protein kinase SRPK3
MKKDIEGNSHCVKMLEHFYFEDSEHKYIALVFEKLAKSLYDFIKSNKYRGYPMPIIQSFARQILQGISFMHEKLNLTHTDLKPENLLLKHSKNEVIKTKSQWPKVNKISKIKFFRSTY